MTPECHIVRDIQPLYQEGLVSDGTAAFVRQHLETCNACRAAYAAAQAGRALEDAAAQNRQPGQEAHALLALKKKLRRRAALTALLVAGCLLLLLGLLRCFPVYRIARVASLSYYDAGPLSLLASIGSPADRAQAEAVLRQADAAFADLTHTSAENEAQYGLLSRYATPAERGAVRETHTLELWSAHLEETTGYLWVYYSQETFDADGATVSGSARVPSLWRVERNAAGQWSVTQIREHP